MPALRQLTAGRFRSLELILPIAAGKRLAGTTRSGCGLRCGHLSRRTRPFSPVLRFQQSSSATQPCLPQLSPGLTWLRQRRSRAGVLRCIRYSALAPVPFTPLPCALGSLQHMTRLSCSDCRQFRHHISARMAHFVPKCAPGMWLRLRIRAIVCAHWPLNRGCAPLIGPGGISRRCSLRTLWRENLPAELKNNYYLCGPGENRAIAGVARRLRKVRAAQGSALWKAQMGASSWGLQQKTTAFRKGGKGEKGR